jgi:SAM-dependent methyltransferase
MAQGSYSGLGATFDMVAEPYHRIRPGYPAGLFEDLAIETGLGAGAMVVEIGAGTGQATRRLLERGWSVTALEPGPALAAVARRTLTGVGDLDVVVAPFEQWQRNGRRYDLIVAATAWHWLDAHVAYRKAAETLRHGGHLAIVATDHVLPSDGDELFRDIQHAYEQVGMGDGQGGPEPPEAIQAPDVEAIASSGLFATPTVHRYLRSRSYTTDEYLTLLSTYSNHIAARPEQRNTLFTRIRDLIEARPSATIRKHYLNTLQVARRLD